jgi:pimeloyl-ACP methyl ester carboxylesterase
MVDQFMEILGIERAPILGHSMGGTVALSFALTHPQRVTKVGVVGSPIEGRSLNFFLRFAGRDWVQLAQSLPTATHMIVNTLVRINTARDTQRVRKMLLHDVDKTSMESFFRSIGDLRRTDLSASLGELTMPVLGIYGAHDNIVDPARELLDQHVSRTHGDAPPFRHFPMLDEPEEFNTTVRSFLSA